VSLTEHRIPTCTEKAQIKLLQQARQWHMLTPPQAHHLLFPFWLLPLALEQRRLLEAQEYHRLGCLAFPQEGWRNQDEAQHRLVSHPWVGATERKGMNTKALQRRRLAWDAAQGQTPYSCSMCFQVFEKCNHFEDHPRVRTQRCAFP